MTKRGITSYIGRAGFALLVCLFLLLARPAAGVAITFTGHVETDFTGSGVVTVTDTVYTDVFVPASAPLSAWPGWDVEELRFAWNSVTDTLYVGVLTPVNTYLGTARNIFGEADGNRDLSTVDPWLSSAGGTDVADFGTGEYMALLLDLDQSGGYDVMVGVTPAGTLSNSFGAYAYTPGAWNPGSSFGAAIPGHAVSPYASPSSEHPGFEFTVANFSTISSSISGLADPDPLRFGVRFYVGSGVDDGVGEETAPDLPTTVVVPEPAAAQLLSLSLAALLWGRRRRV